MLSSGDVERCLSLLEADGRRRLTEEEKRQTTDLWVREFRDLAAPTFEGAVMGFIREKPRGRPSLGELWAMVKRDLPASEAKSERAADQKLFELRWAVEILEAEPEFRRRYVQQPAALASGERSIDLAEHYLRRYGYTHWHDAKAFCEPGWVPSTVTEIQF